MLVFGIQNYWSDFLNMKHERTTLHWRYVGGQINKLRLQLSVIFSPGWTLLI